MKYHLCRFAEFDRNAEDLGVNAYFKQLGFVPTGLCFLNFQVMYLFDFEM